MADKYGRKPMFGLGVCISAIVCLILLKSSSSTILYIALLFGGIANVATIPIANLYAIEIMPLKYAKISFLTIAILFGLTKIIINLYFMFSTSKEWKYIGYASISILTLSFIVTLKYLKESPRWLFDNKGEKR